MINRKQDAKKWAAMNDRGRTYSEIATEAGVSRSIVAGAVWRFERGQTKYAVENLTKKGYTFRDIENLVLGMGHEKAKNIINSLGVKNIRILDISHLPLLYKLLKEGTCTI